MGVKSGPLKEGNFFAWIMKGFNKLFKQIFFVMAFSGVVAGIDAKVGLADGLRLGVGQEFKTYTRIEQRYYGGRKKGGDLEIETIPLSLAEFLKINFPHTINLLDLGTSNKALFCFRIKEFCKDNDIDANIYGVSPHISPEVQRKAKGERITLYKNTIEELAKIEQQEQRYNVIILNAPDFHLFDIEEFLHIIDYLLAKGGVVIIRHDAYGDGGGLMADIILKMQIALDSQWRELAHIGLSIPSGLRDIAPLREKPLLLMRQGEYLTVEKTAFSIAMAKKIGINPDIYIWVVCNQNMERSPIVAHYLLESIPMFLKNHVKIRSYGLYSTTQMDISVLESFLSKNQILRRHSPKQLPYNQLRKADLILVMTESQKRPLEKEGARNVRLLIPGQDLDVTYSSADSNPYAGFERYIKENMPQILALVFEEWEKILIERYELRTPNSDLMYGL